MMSWSVRVRMSWSKQGECSEKPFRTIRTSVALVMTKNGIVVKLIDHRSRVHLVELGHVQRGHE